MATRKIYETLITVEGAGRFPLDMLRTDTCFPNSEDDARRMGCELHSTRRVVLRQRSTVVRPPDRERWLKFGWTVKEAQIVK